MTSYSCAYPDCKRHVEWEFCPDDSMCQEHWEAYTSFWWWRQDEGRVFTVEEWLKWELENPREQLLDTSSPNATIRLQTPQTPLDRE